MSRVPLRDYIGDAVGMLMIFITLGLLLVFTDAYWQ